MEKNMMEELSPLKEVRKRDGTIVPFDQEKIIYAISRALRAIGRPDRILAKKLATEVIRIVSDNSTKEAPDVEQIQDEVEHVLFNHGNYKLAKSYMLYRSQREKVRNTKDLFTNLDVVDSYLELEDWRVKESANSSYSLQGLNQHVSTIISSQYWLDRVYPVEVSEAHRTARFHIHDLGFLSVYCVGWDLQDLLITGFNGVKGKTHSKPAKHFRTALGQVVNFFYTMQGEAAGAQAFSNFDTYLAPFIRYDDLDYNQVKQAIQEFLFNINTPTRVGFQTPFTNVTMDLKVPGFIANQPVVIGGISHTEVYGDFQNELDLFNRAFAEAMSEGDANGAVFSFPIPTYNITKDFEWDNPNYYAIFEMAARYGIPYFSNFVSSDLNPDDVRSMCCRLRLDKRELIKRGGGLFGANPLTGSVGVVTLNLPRLGYEAKCEKELYDRIDKLMVLAKTSLEIKRKSIEALTERGLFPYSRFYLRDLRKKNGSYWSNHFSTIGIVGMNECCMNFLGKDIVSTEGNALAHRLMDFMNERIVSFQEETGHIYNLEATPAESTSYKLARIDKAVFPDIIVANEQQVQKGAEPYYTNSSQLPVNYTDDLLLALSIQDPLQTKYTGGTVFHVFVGEKQIPIESVKNLIKKVTENFKMPYFTLSPTFSICPNHGYIYGEHKICPECKSKGEEVICEVFARIVGYLRPVDQWNNGKQEEYKLRKGFDSNLALQNSSIAKNRSEILEKMQDVKYRTVIE